MSDRVGDGIRPWSLCPEPKKRRPLPQPPLTAAELAAVERLRARAGDDWAERVANNTALLYILETIR